MINYIIEIQNRSFLIILTSFSSLWTTYFYKEVIMFKMLKHSTILNVSFEKTILYFIFTNVTEIFIVYLNIVFFIGFQIFLVYSVYHCFIFSSLALSRKEYKFVRVILTILFITWFCSLLLTNILLIPLTWEFFMSFQNSILKTNCLTVHFEINILKFYDFCLYIYFVSFCYCQTFSFFFFTFNYFNYSLKSIKRYRKIYYFCFLLFSSLITVDVLSQISITLLFSFLYETFTLFFIIYYNIIKIQ